MNGGGENQKLELEAKGQVEEDNKYQRYVCSRESPKSPLLMHGLINGVSVFSFIFKRAEVRCLFFLSYSACQEILQESFWAQQGHFKDHCNRMTARY